MQRRVFVRDGAMALVTLGLSPGFLRRVTFATELPAARKGKILICLFQRGAADGISMVVPHGETAYYAARPNIAIPRPRSGATDAAIDLARARILISAGQHDPIVPRHQTERLATLMKAAGADVTLSWFDTGHGLISPELDAAARWFAEHKA